VWANVTDSTPAFRKSGDHPSAGRFQRQKQHKCGISHYNSYRRDEALVQPETNKGCTRG
jgi:hypothetical protein